MILCRLAKKRKSRETKENKNKNKKQKKKKEKEKRGNPPRQLDDDEPHVNKRKWTDETETEIIPWNLIEGRGERGEGGGKV